MSIILRVVVMLNALMLNAGMPNAILPCVVVLTVVAPLILSKKFSTTKKINVLLLLLIGCFTGTYYKTFLQL